MHLDLGGRESCECRRVGRGVSLGIGVPVVGDGGECHVVAGDAEMVGSSRDLRQHIVSRGVSLRQCSLDLDPVLDLAAAPGVGRPRSTRLLRRK